MNQPDHFLDLLARDTPERSVLGRPPGAGAIQIAAHQGVQAAVGAQEEQRQFALFGVRLDPTLLVDQARKGGLARAEHPGLGAARETQQLRGPDEGPRQDPRLLGGVRGLVRALQGSGGGHFRCNNSTNHCKCKPCLGPEG